MDARLALTQIIQFQVFHASVGTSCKIFFRKAPTLERSLRAPIANRRHVKFNIVADYTNTRLVQSHFGRSIECKIISSCLRCQVEHVWLISFKSSRTTNNAICCICAVDWFTVNDDYTWSRIIAWPKMNSMDAKRWAARTFKSSQTLRWWSSSSRSWQTRYYEQHRAKRKTVRKIGCF